MGMADGHAVAAGLGIAQRLLGVAQRGVAVEYVIDGRLIQCRHFLGHDRQPPVRWHRQAAGVGLQLAAEQREQRTLAASVTTGQADLPAAVQGDAGMVEKNVGAAPQTQVVELDHGPIMSGK